jgi:hypothetical protein
MTHLQLRKILYYPGSCFIIKHTVLPTTCVDVCYSLGHTAEPYFVSFQSWHFYLDLFSKKEKNRGIVTVMVALLSANFNLDDKFLCVLSSYLATTTLWTRPSKRQD